METWSRIKSEIFCYFVFVYFRSSCNAHPKHFESKVLKLFMRFRKAMAVKCVNVCAFFFFLICIQHCWQGFMSSEHKLSTSQSSNICIAIDLSTGTIQIMNGFSVWHCRCCKKIVQHNTKQFNSVNFLQSDFAVQLLIVISMHTFSQKKKNSSPYGHVS